MKLTNAGKGGVTLPLRMGPDGAVFPCRVRKDGTTVPLVPCLLLERESIDVPSWYVDELVVEDGHGTRLRNGTLVLSGGAPTLPDEAAPADAPPTIDPETTDDAAPEPLAEVATEAPTLPDEAAPADAPPTMGKGKKRRG